MQFLNAISKIEGIGPQKTKLLLNFFGTAENAWQANLNELKLSGIGEKMAEKMHAAIKHINPDQEWEKLKKENIRLIPFDDPLYPSLLKETANPPYTIYVKGTIDFNSAPMVSIVGARKYTSYGAQIARELGKELSSSGVTVVSGMALGIDALVHKGALDGGGKTVAVLGNSLDDKNIYPINNFALSRSIMENGALVSEYPIETVAGKTTFPARNRIIAGLSLGTVVVEAGEKSGSLITARLALDYNREVFAVPGSIFSPVSLGPHTLIKSGAKVVTCVKDILEELSLSSSQEKIKLIVKKPATETEERLLKIITNEPIHIDKLRQTSKLQTAVLSSVLSMMEIKGWVKNIGGQNYIQLN